MRAGRRAGCFSRPPVCLGDSLSVLSFSLSKSGCMVLCLFLILSFFLSLSSSFMLFFFSSLSFLFLFLFLFLASLHFFSPLFFYFSHLPVSLALTIYFSYPSLSFSSLSFLPFSFLPPLSLSLSFYIILFSLPPLHFPLPLSFLHMLVRLAVLCHYLEKTLSIFTRFISREK